LAIGERGNLFWQPVGTNVFGFSFLKTKAMILGSSKIGPTIHVCVKNHYRNWFNNY